MALLDITVKTLDGQNRSFSVPEEMTVRSFKEKISNSIEIPADTQRLIFHGRVMQDDKKLKEYDIHGKAVHVVQRAPPSSTSTTDEGPSTPNPLPNPNNVDGSMLDVQIHFGGMNTAATSRDARHRIQQAEINVGIINNALNLLEQRTGITAAQCPQEDPEDAEASATPTASTDDDMDTSGAQREATATATPSSPGSQEPSTGNQAQDSPEGLSATQLADFLDRVLVTSRRMAPHLRMYRNYLREEETYAANSQGARSAQEVANRVMEAVHAMSHVMHSLSDVMVDMHTEAPRQATANPVSPFAMTGTNTMAIPIHMNVRARSVDGNGSGATRGRGRGQAAPTQRSTDAAAAGTGGEAGTQPPQAAPPPQPSANLEGIQMDEPVLTVHNIQAAVVTDDLMMEEGMHFDIGGVPASTSISVVSATQEHGQPASSTATSTATSTSNETSRTSTSTSTTSRTSTSNTPPATAGFTVGPTTNVNVGGSGFGPLPNVPGLPGGMLQNIVQSILTNHGVQPGHPVQVNVLHPSTLGSIHSISIQQPRHPGPTSTAQSRPTPTAQQTSTTSASDNSNSTTNSNPGTGPNPIPGINSRSTNTPRPIFINRGGRPTPYPMGPRQAHPRPPGAAPRPGNGGPHSRGFVDMFLPCTSHHYNSQTARHAARSARNQGQQQVPNLSTMVSGMVGDLFGGVGHVHQHMRNNGNRTTPSGGASVPNTSTTTTGTSSQPTNQSPTMGPNPGVHGFNPLQMLANLMSPPGVGGGGVQHVGPGGPGGPGGAIHLDLTSLMANMMGANQPPQNVPGNNASTNPGNNNSSPAAATTTATSNTNSGGAPPPVNPMGGTLADLFPQFTSQMGSSGDVDQSEPSFIQALIESVAPHVRLTDLFSLVMGNTRVIGQLRGSLCTFVQERVTQIGSIENVVNSAVDNMNSEIVYITGRVEVRSGVDISQSIRNCLKYHLQQVIEAILSQSPANQDEYGRELYNLWMTMLAEVVALCVYCIRNGQPGFASMLQQYMPRMTRDLNPAITIWMSTSVQDILSSFHRNHPVPEADILRFVAHTSSSASQQVTAENKTKTETSSSSTSAQDTPAVTQSGSQPQANTQVTAVPRTDGTDTVRNVPMDVSESPSSLPPRAKVPRTQQVKESDSGDEFVDAPEEFTSRPAAAARPSQIATSSSSRVTEGVRNGNREASSQWQSIVPQEWLPVINQDIERQKEQRPQPPHSDAYLQGLPAKRRRMMVLEHAGEMGNMPQYLPSAIARAARVAGVEPISSEQNLMQEAKDDKELHDELEQEVQAIVESRITSDQDFNSERFPNSIRYFQKPKSP